MSNHSENVPKAMVDAFVAVTALTDAFCRERLDEEYAQMMRFAAAALARKRPSPLASGTAATWVAGIAHAVGSINFLSTWPRGHTSPRATCTRRSGSPRAPGRGGPRRCGICWG